jgi:hypothetical protein
VKYIPLIWSALWRKPADAEIFVMRADGTDVRQLTDNQWEEGTFAWAPRVSGAARLHAAGARDR